MNTQSGDQDIAELLARSGGRQEPSDAARARVRLQLLEVWEQLPAPTSEHTPGHGEAANSASHESTSQSARLSFVQPSAIAAAIGVLAVGALFTWQMRTIVPDLPIAEVAYSTGGYAISPAGDGSSQLFAGTTVTTSGEGRLLLSLDTHTSIRVDKGTRVTLRDDDEIYLHSGRVYVDSHGGNNDVRISTDDAVVSKVGTQFEVHLDDQVLQVAVREGEVKVARKFDNKHAKARAGIGEVLRYAGPGPGTRVQIPTTDETRWHWTQLSRPDFDMSQGNYHAYFRWAARERGLTLLFEDQVLEQLARSQLGTGHYDASDADIERVLQTERYYSRLLGAPHELRIGRR